MSQESAKRFMELLSRDEELQKKVQAATEGYTGDKADEKAVFEAVLAPVVREAGYDFTFEDMAELAKSPAHGELSDEEMDAVAGGGFCFGIGFGSGNQYRRYLCGGGYGWTPGTQCKGVGLGIDLGFGESESLAYHWGK